MNWPVAIFVSAGLAIQSAAPAAEAPARGPDILFIMTDQQRWDCVGANGNKLIRTPNLDRLAARGANFTHAFVSSPVCVPSRISFFTGRYAHSHRNRVNYTPLDRREVLMQARLKGAGYRTGVVGKLHYHPPTRDEAIRTGFDLVELHDAAVGTSKLPVKAAVFGMSLGLSTQLRAIFCSSSVNPMSLSRGSQNS
jgi:hypothetical protein